MWVFEIKMSSIIIKVHQFHFNVIGSNIYYFLVSDG